MGTRFLFLLALQACIRHAQPPPNLDPAHAQGPQAPLATIALPAAEETKEAPPEHHHHH
jgi:hypothetical protein